MTCKLDSCKAEFQPRTKWQAFCSPKCRNVYHNACKAAKHACKPLVVLLIPNILLTAGFAATLSFGGLA